jgi:hypothetical protein
MAVGVAGTSAGSDDGVDGAMVEDVGVDEGERGLGADVDSVPHDTCVVEEDTEALASNTAASARTRSPPASAAASQRRSTSLSAWYCWDGTRGRSRRRRK